MVEEEPTNVLVVDDLPEKLLVYRAILGELGQNLITAGSGEEALRAVLANDFAVILLDVNMPGMNGLETASLIRRRRRSARTPIIFLTAFADEVRAAEGYAQGAVDYITTPVVPAVLRAKVRVFCDLYRMTQQVRRQAEERIALAQERTRREAAEEANRRLAFSAMTGGVLGQSLDQRVTAHNVARLPVPDLADLVVLALRSPHGDWTTTLARAGEDGAAVEEGVGRDRLPPELADALARAMVDGSLVRSGNDAAVAVPLRARSQTFGALALCCDPSGRRFGPADLTLAEAYASRAAIALDNARLYQEVQQADRQKNEFLSMLAHELRNPLAPIWNANEVLRQMGADPQRVRWAQGVIDRQLTHLVRLVDDLLDVSRLTQGKIRLAVELVDLEAVVNHAVEATRPLIDKLGHRLEVVLPPRRVRLHADPARLTQVLTNLLNNAAKYTEPGGHIWLAVNVEPGGLREAKPNPADRPTGDGLPPHHASVEIRVRDTGVGIPPELLPGVFELFTQSSQTLDRSQGGLGIGLTLVRRLVEMHGGTVMAHSDGPGRGSEFVVRLPVQSDEPPDVLAPTPESANPSSEPNPLRIVIVDDNLDGVESLADLLELLGHQVRVAHDGPAGIDTVRMFDPDVVLLDIGLPGMDGYEVARRLRHDVGSDAVLVAVSGYGRDEDRRMSREAGFEQHFVKPMELGTLQTLLGSVRTTRRS
jgi:signal transduction histidine kinase/DNA-binding response OmpR family regulator